MCWYSVSWCCVCISKMCIDVISVLVMTSDMMCWISMVVIRLNMAILGVMGSVMVVTSLPVVMWGFVSVHCMEVMSSHISVMVTVMIIVVVHWLHLQNQVAARGVNIGWVEN